MRCAQTCSTGDLGGEWRSIWTGKVRGCSLSWKGASSLVIVRCPTRISSFKPLELCMCTLGVNFNMSYREPLLFECVSFVLTITTWVPDYSVGLPHQQLRSMYNDEGACSPTDVEWSPSEPTVLRVQVTIKMMESTASKANTFEDRGQQWLLLASDPSLDGQPATTTLSGVPLSIIARYHQLE
jgi:hypothetical protein